MKKVFVMTVLFVATITLATAQQPRTPITAEESAKRQTERVDQAVKLTGDQKTKIQAIDLDFAKKTIELRQNRGDRDAMRAKMQELDAARDAKYKGVLTADQFKKYSEDKAKREKEMQERRAQGGQGGQRGQRGNN